MATATVNANKGNKGNKGKAAKAKPVKVEKKERGLSESRIKILTALKKNISGLTRAQLSEKTGINKGWAKLLGAASKDEKPGGMEGDGLVRSEIREDTRGMIYTITSKGKAALVS